MYLVPASSEAALDVWRHAADPVLSFLEETFEPSDEHWISGSSLYIAYRTWSEANGYRPLSGRKFGERAKRAGVAHRKNSSVEYALRRKSHRGAL